MTMNPKPNKTRGRSSTGDGPRRWLLRGALLAGLALTAAPPGLAQVTGTGGGDSVGSLPDEHGGVPGNVAPAPDLLPVSLVVTGRPADLRALVLRVTRLDGPAGASPVSAPMDVSGAARLTLQGSVELVLDRRVLERSFASFSLELGAPFAGGAVRVLAGEHQRVFPAGLQPLDLHLQQLAWSGLADAGVLLRVTPPLASASVLDGLAGRLDITATAETVRLVLRPERSRLP